MESTNSFQLGEEVFHASNPKVWMVIEAMNDKEIFCTWIDMKTSEKREGSFSPLSLRKVDKRPPYIMVETLP
jgi:hypothetical protein